ncbi:hypothetical protein B0H10DRAFT_1971937 [Mycena sp. CBHHK59/15]|nr:hypothetical protein B0H10DRAFT_1971937 [Mycena sp. CBHHK59/15]
MTVTVTAHPKRKLASRLVFPVPHAIGTAMTCLQVHEEEMAGRQVDRLSQLHHKDLYSTIDAIQQGDIPWQSFSVTYTGPLPESGDVPAWMMEKYEVWYRSPLAIFEKQLANPDFKDEMDWAQK